MKKNVKIMSLLAFGFVVAGALSLNVSNTQGDVTAYSNIPTENEFIMDVGASVRIPDVENSDVTTNDNGIRFTGLVGATLAESGVEEAGTFILPLYYWERDVISEEKCFGESAVYTWTGDENADAKGNAKQIIHVAGTLYKENANDTFYVVKGSALHIKDDNLDVDYIGCSYLKLATGDYVFAETDANNARSVVEVAQKALLNAEAELNSAEDKLEELLGKLDEAKTLRDDKINSLTEEDDFTISDDGGEDSDEDEDEEDETVINTVATVQPVVNAPANTPAVVTPVTPTPVVEEQNLVTIDDNQVPLASGTENVSVEEPKADAEKELVTIEEEEVPLAAMPTEEEKATMSWWWLLIVAAMGATGYKLYRDHQKKKEVKVK